MVNSFTGICLLARVAKVFWTCVMQVQRKFRSDSVHVAPLETAGIFNVEMIPYCGPMSHGTRGRLAWVRWGLGLGGRPCWLSVSLCCISILLRSLSMSGVALSTRLMRALRLRDPVHDLASARGHEWLATCVPVQDVLLQGILSSSMTCGISGCSEEAVHVTASWW